MKNKLIKSFFVLAIFLFFPFSAWSAYDPLVQIPGLPSSSITISMYLIGLYNFMLAIVGIIALLMIIIGGMRYISAAGNISNVTEAKSIIGSAIGGLILAIFSWVIVGTINADLLYLDNPTFVVPNVRTYCYTAYDSVNQECTCLNGRVLPGVSNESLCETECTNAGFCTYINPDFFSGCAAFSEPIEGNCICGNDKTVAYVDGLSCSDICETDDPENCGKGKFLYVKITARDVDCSFSVPDDSYVLSSLNLAYGCDPTDPTATTSRDPDVLYDLFISDDGTINDFNVTATTKLDNSGNPIPEYTCAILVSNRGPGVAVDYLSITWVEENTVLGTDTNIWKSIESSSFAPCCGGILSGVEADCLVNSPTWSLCFQDDLSGNNYAEKVLKTNFSYNILNDLAGDKTFAAQNSSGLYGYFLESPIICTHGSWKPIGA